jgi:hypothetical protein
VVAIIGLALTAFSAGYVVGKDAADTDDADDEASSDDEGDGTDEESSDERSRMTLEHGPDGLEVRVITGVIHPRRGDLEAEVLLARLRKDRRGTLRHLLSRTGWRIVGPSMATSDVWAFIESSVQADGTIVLDPPAPDGPALALVAPPASLTGVEVAVALAVMTLVAFGVGVAVGYAVNDNEPPGGAETDDDTDGSDTGDDGGDSDGDGGGGGSGSRVARPVVDHLDGLPVRLTVHIDEADEAPGRADR